MDSIGIDTPFAHVLNTNHVPTSEERDELRDLIRAPEEQLQKLDEEISRLHARRQALQQFIDLHRSLLSPARRVPVDVWRSIFTECLPDNELGLCFRTTKEAPLLLTSVCRSWRETALSTPTLWRSIHIYLPVPHWPHDSNGSYISALRDRKERLKGWLDRSGALPLTISLATDASYGTYESLNHLLRSSNTVDAIPILQTEFTELLAQYSHRWRTVAFGKGVEALDLAPFERLTPDVLASLESYHGSGMLWDIELNTGPAAGIREKLPPLVKILAQAQSLRRLRLANESISETTLSIPVPWSNLTELSMPTLHLASITPGRFMQMLATKCHSLITLSYDLGSSRRFDDVIPQENFDAPVQWPSLQNIRMAFEGPSFRFDGVAPFDGDDAVIATFDPNIADIFRSVVLPALSRFSIGFAEYYIPYHNYENGPATFAIEKLPFEDFLQHSQVLTHLELLSPRIFSAAAILRVVRPLETLVSLNLGHKTPGHSKGPRDSGLTFQASWRRAWLERILQALLPSVSDLKSESQNGAFFVCPRLEEFNVGGCSSDETDILLDFAMKKLTLTVLRVDFGTVRTPEIGEFLESEGVRVLKDVRSVVLDWRWDEQDSDMKPWFESPTSGIPGESPW
ncbi:hypothetical protein PQX77_016342 [Marasmius sp. AFHP31]|nr:hypothetical protein PQX77_016342 [Marasmius sp. AFHP31]